MYLPNIFRTFVVLFFLAFVVGCAAPVTRTLAEDQAIKSVAVISLLEEKTQVKLVGLTVFNNKTAVVDQTNVLNNVAVDTVEAALRKSRPGWVLKDARPETAAMISKLKSASGFRSSKTREIAPDISQLAKKLNVDLVFVVVDSRVEDSHGQGVGIVLRTLSLASVKNANVHAICHLYLFGRDGQELAIRWTGGVAFGSVPAADLNLDYELTNISSKETQDRLEKAMQDRLKIGLTSATTGMGY